MIRYTVYRALQRIVRRLPTRTAYRSASIVADVMSITSPRSRRILVGNLREVAGDVGDPAMRRMVRVAFRNLVWSYLELFRPPPVDRAGRSPDAIDRLDRGIRAATADGRGGVVAFCHVGCIELAVRAVRSASALRFAVVVERMADERMFQFFCDLRRAGGLELVHADEPRRICQLLEEGCIIAIAADLDTTDRGIDVGFLGRPARMPTGAVKLAMRTGAPLLFAHAWRTSLDTDPQRFDASIVGPIEVPASARTPSDVEANVARLAELVEAAVTEHPEQWLAFRPVWGEPT